MSQSSCLTRLALGLWCCLLNINLSQAFTEECAEQAATATFFQEDGLLCLQKITIEEQAGMAVYRAALKWSGTDNASQFKVLETDQDSASAQDNPSFSIVEGILNLPKVDIPKRYGTERYVANLVLADKDDFSVFELSSVAVYINPDYIPHVTWKPYGMLDLEQRRAVDLLGRSMPYAKLADAVYNFNNLVINQEWVLFEKKDSGSGMQAAVYYNQQSDEVVLAFRGTETCDFPCSLSETAEFLLDTAADTLLTFGLADMQFEDAYDYAQDVINRAQGRKIIVTGHSLGGGLAQAVGAAFGLETFAFNSAPVPDGFFDNYSPALPFEVLSEMIYVLADIHDPVSNTDETGKFYQNAMHVSSLIQFDFDLKEVLPDERRKLKDLRFDRHSIADLINNASSLLNIYQEGW